MSNRTCPVRACTEPVPCGPYAIFCAECHFKLPYRTTNAIFRLQIDAARTQDDEVRSHLHARIAGYVSVAARNLENDDAA